MYIRRNVFIPFVFVFIVSLFSCSSNSKLTQADLKNQIVEVSDSEVKFHESIKNTSGPVPVLVLHGTPYEQGLAYGVLMHDELAKVYKLYNKIIEQNISQLTGIKKLIGKSVLKSYTKKLEKITPERYIQEMKGLSEGSGIPYTQIASISYGSYFGMECTAVVSIPNSNNNVYLGRNFDYAPYFLGEFPLLIRYESENEIGSWTLNAIGYLPWMQGCNDDGVSLCINAAGNNKAKPNGISMGWKIREILSNSKSLSDVEKNISSSDNDSRNWILSVSSAKEKEGAVFDLVNNLKSETKIGKGEHTVVFNQPFEGKCAEGKDYVKQNTDLLKTLSEANIKRRKSAAGFLSTNNLETPENIWGLLRCHDFPYENIWCTGLTTICNDITLFSIVFDLENNNFTFAYGNSWSALREVYKFNLVTHEFTKFLPADSFVVSDDFKKHEGIYLDNMNACFNNAGTNLYSVMGPYYYTNRIFFSDDSLKNLSNVFDGCGKLFPDLVESKYVVGFTNKNIDTSKAIKAFNDVLQNPACSGDRRFSSLEYLCEIYKKLGDKENEKKTAALWLNYYNSVSENYEISDNMEKVKKNMEKLVK